MANIPNFESEEFDDPKELRKELTRVLRDINKDANAPVSINLGKKVVLVWYNDKETPLPTGYERADGQNGTVDMRQYNQSGFYYIQKVR